MKTRAITLHIDGEEYQLTVPVHRTLLQVMREDLNLVGTKYGCGTGECGACTVLVNGTETIDSCLTLAAIMHGKKITTIASLEKDGKLNPVQQAFVNKDAIQCGYCTSGMVLKTTSILAKNPHPTQSEIRSGLEGNICRCTGYQNIVEAVQHASELISGKVPE